MRTLFSSLTTAFVFYAMGGYAEPPRPILVPEEDGLTPETHELIWSAEPSVRYQVDESTNLPSPSSWSPAPGYPAAATSVVEFLGINATTSDAAFFRVGMLDEQPPEIVDRLPDDADFAVRRFGTIEVELSDVTGVDSNSIQMTVGALGTFTVADSEVSFSNQVVRFDMGGSIALGGWGETVDVSLVAADLSAYAATNTWSFELEVDPLVVSNLFVFGSPAAQSAGQQIGDIPTRALAQQMAGGPIRMNGAADPWTLDGVYTDRIEIVYASNAPPIAVDTYLANLTPASVDEIFYRLITSVSNDPVGQRLTLFTVDVGLEEMVNEGSLSVSSDSVVLNVDSNGVIQQALSLSSQVPLDPIGISLDGAHIRILHNGYATDWGALSLAAGSGATIIDIQAEELNWWLTPSLRVGMDFASSGLNRFEGVLRGDLQSSTVLDTEVLLAGVALDLEVFDLPPVYEPSVLVLIGVIGVPPVAIPVYAQIKFDLVVTADALAASYLQFRAGVRHQAATEFGLDYVKQRDPAVEWIRDFSFAPAELVWDGFDLSGELSLKLKLKPSVSFLVYGLAGAEVSIAPRGGVVFAVNPPAPLAGRFEADVSFSIEPDGLALAWLQPKPSLSLTLWEDDWHLFPDEETLLFTQPPENQTVVEGEDARFSCTVNRTSGVSYKWYFNGTQMPFETHDYLNLLNVNTFHEGEYMVRVHAGGLTIDSTPVTLNVMPSEWSPPNLADYALIPGGTFIMGSPTSELGRWSDETQHQVTLTRDFFIQKTEVTNRQMADVLNWAKGQNKISVTSATVSNLEGSGQELLDLDSSYCQISWNGSQLVVDAGKESYPCIEVTWYGAQAYCNYLSDIQGLNRAISFSNWSMNLNANGYRLPTESEWEYACRAGTTTAFYTGGITYTGSSPVDPNLDAAGWYWGNSTNPDNPMSSGKGTHRVGQKQANAWGLFDTHGNVWEWCWDWYGTYPGTVTDPPGPASGTYRVFRGGSWYLNAQGCRSALRNNDYPTRSNFLGFRPARSSVP